MSGLLSFLMSLPVVVQSPMPGTPIVECRLPGDAGARVYQLIDKGADRDPRWWLTLGSPALGVRVIELPLPNARVTRTAGRTAVASASANGGLIVELLVAEAGALLDVFVNFELEVNVWRDLSPEVEQMNTGGPRRDAQCVRLKTKN